VSPRRGRVAKLRDLLCEICRSRSASKDDAIAKCNGPHLSRIGDAAQEDRRRVLNWRRTAHAMIDRAGLSVCPDLTDPRDLLAQTRHPMLGGRAEHRIVTRP
jgi:hypothetical protein